MFMVHQGFADRLLGSRYAWLLLDQDGTSRLATPPGFPTPVGLATQQVEQVVTRVGTELPGWGLLVSVPRSHPDFHNVVQTLLGKGGRPLRQAEWDVIRDAGMDIPFGEWATNAWADLFLFEGGAGR